jgi:hypothetical protein
MQGARVQTAWFWRWVISWGFEEALTDLGISQGRSLPESVWPRNVSPHREPAVHSAIEARVEPSLSITKPSPFHSSAAGLLPCLLSARRDICTRLQVALKAALPCCEALPRLASPPPQRRHVARCINTSPILPRKTEPCPLPPPTA